MLVDRDEAFDPVDVDGTFVDRRETLAPPVAHASSGVAIVIDALLRFSLGHRALVIAGALGFVVLAAGELSRMRLDVLPDLGAPRISIVTDAPGLAPTEVEHQGPPRRYEANAFYDRVRPRDETVPDEARNPRRIEPRRFQ